jgi:hypothetical protein
VSFLDPYIEYATTYVDWPFLYVLGNVVFAAFFLIAGVARLIGSSGRDVRPVSKESSP